MIRKKYISPSVETVYINIQQKLLFGSSVDSIAADGLLDESLEQEKIQDEDPESIWNEAW